MQNITPQELKEKLKNSNSKLVLIDVRSPQEHAQNSIPNSQNIPAMDILKKASELKKYPEIVLYCQSGGRSKLAGMLLMGAGINQTYNLIGGMNEWLKSN
jgi:phage shock protein E